MRARKSIAGLFNANRAWQQNLVQRLPLRKTRQQSSGNKQGYQPGAKLPRVEKPFYRYGVYHAADLARRLNVPRISVLEFGVAGGNGLIALERHAEEVERLFRVDIDVYGFDTGGGLPEPKDYRDMPYRFSEGNYEMNVSALRARLSRAHLVLGDIRDTAPVFLRDYAPAPVGFAAFDMDYYSSTMDALGLFASASGHDYFLPRMQLYFDDINGTALSSYNTFVGELAAIDDFNQSERMVKIAENRSLRARKKYKPWHSQMFVMHRFSHALYGQYISSATANSLRLKK